MAYVTEPKYDNDPANKAYVDGAVSRTVSTAIANSSKNFGAQPTPPYFINDTWTDGTDLWICTTERLIGSFQSSDWSKATEYVPETTMQTYVASEIDDYNTIVEAALADLQDQIDGVVDVWFYSGVPTLSNEPAVNWTTNAMKDEHLADIYYNVDNGDGYRFVYENSTYYWLQMSDSQAAAAYQLAEDAMAVADSKRRIFTTTPFTPYEVGDLWSQGTNLPLKICTTERLTGSYNSTDWSLASNADNTQTVIDGGLVTTGTLQVKDGAGTTKAGITGNTSATSDSDIRIWAGQTYANRASAPFRVTQGGAMNATSGVIGGWAISATSLTTDTPNYISGLYNVGTNEGYGFLVVYKKSDASYPFYVTQSGFLSAQNADIKGTISSSTISASSITGTSFSAGTIDISNKFKVNSSLRGPELTNTVGGFLTLGNSNFIQPWISGLNVGNSGLAFYTGTAVNGTSGTKYGGITGTTSPAMYIGAEGTMNIDSAWATGMDAGTYMRISSGNSSAAGTNTGSTYITASANITLNASGSVYAKGNGIPVGKILTDQGTASSLSVKENIQVFKEEDYNDAISLLRDTDIYKYKYKYNLYKNRDQYGFIIDKVQTNPLSSKFYDFDKDTVEIVEGNINYEHTDSNQEKIIIKKYNPDVLDKYLLTVCKAQQKQIDLLTERLERLERK